MTVILVRYSEIALKGANRYLFERQLRDNIIRALGLPPSMVRQSQTQLVITSPEEKEQVILDRLRKVFGIAWYARTKACRSALEDIVGTCLEVADGTIKTDNTFAIRAQRSDKKLPFSSVDIENEAGEAIRKASHAGVDLKNPDVTVFVSASSETTYVYTEKIQGPGGLPVGSSGHVLSLISGGPDSIASSYRLAKRGAVVDFLHFHVFPDRRQVLDSKVAEIAAGLSTSTFSKNLYLASYTPFMLRVMDIKKPKDKYELVIFRRLMARVGERLAIRHGYQALVLGDSLGQVASQTMENIVAVEDAVNIPIFRPLIGMDKLEITRLVQRIGLFEEAIAPYKDCCSIIAPNPIIKAYLPRVRALEEELDIQKAVNDIVDAIELVKISELLG